MPIDFRSVSGLAAAFGRIPAEVAVEIRPAITEAGELIMRASQANSSWSSRIPAAHFIRTSLTQGAFVGVDSVAAPHARPYEGRGSAGGFFRHPVFGNRENWVSQATRPFLGPAREAEGEKAKAVIEEAVVAVTRRLI